MESFLYPESYCSLGLTRIHSLFDEEDLFDWFRTPHYPALFHAAAAYPSVGPREHAVGETSTESRDVSSPPCLLLPFQKTSGKARLLRFF